MLKKAALAVFGLVLAMNITTSKAQAEVHVVAAIGTPTVHASVALHPARYRYDGAPYAAYNQAPYAYNNVPNGAYAGSYDGSEQYYGPDQYEGSDRYYGSAERHEWREHGYRDHDRGCRHGKRGHHEHHRYGDRW